MLFPSFLDISSFSNPDIEIWSFISRQICNTINSVHSWSEKLAGQYSDKAYYQMSRISLNTQISFQKD